MAADPDDATVPYLITGFAAYGTVEQSTRPLEFSARLICVSGADLGASFRLDSSSAVVGRGAVGVRLTGTDVSRNHAKISREHDAYYIEDLGSMNRTTVNGAPCGARTVLRFGDRVQLGNTILVFTHHDELETRVHQLQRLDAMTAAVAGMAHDFNNALQVIDAGLEAIEADLPDDAEDCRQPLADMKVAAAAASSLAKRLVKLGRGGSVPHETVEIAHVVDEVVAMARRLVDARISVSSLVPPGLAVRGSRDELQQALLNLCINARDAMPASGGAIQIEARRHQLDHAAAVAKLLQTGGAYIEIAVRDNGSGMDEATLARVFEPFFTTKAPGAGTGLGLAMTHVIVQRHGGSIVAASKVGEGTTFSIWLPSEGPITAPVATVTRR